MDTQHIGTACTHAAPPPRLQRSQSGFSILEVLIAIVILSIGMLGAAGMQAAALQSNKETRNQAVAGTLARELAEKMRGNNNVAIRNPTLAVNPYLFDVTLTKTTTIAPPAQNCFTNANGCPLVDDAAIWDVADWQGRVQLALSSPRVRVCFDQNPFDIAGKPRWACTDNGDIAVLKMSWTRNSTEGKLLFTSASDDLPILVIPLTAGSSQ